MPDLWIPAPYGRISAHFYWTEAMCHHCGRVPSIEGVIETARWAERVRLVLGHPMHVLSWCRCPVHNAAVGGASESYHLKGWAIDFSVKGMTAREVQRAMAKVQGKQADGKLVGGLGIYRGFTHVDRGPARRWTG